MDLGKLKAIFDREFQYVSKINPVLIGYLFIKEVGWNPWYLLLIPVFLVWVYIDLKYIMPKEFDYLHRKSPVMQKLLKNIHES